MKYIFTKNLEDAVYDYNDFKEIQNCCCFDSGNKTVKVIMGTDVPTEIKKEVQIIDNCGYIFRKTLKGGYQALRMTMHPKTAANIMKGSSRYGSMSILREIMND